MNDDESRYLFINLNEAIQKIKEDGINFPVQLKDLQASLREHPAFVNANDLHYFMKQDGQTTIKKRLRAWVFDFTKILNK